MGARAGVARAGRYARGMTQARGMLALDELRALVSAGEVDTIDVAFTDLYGRLLGKRYDAGFFLEVAVPGGAHACDYLLTVDVGMEPVQGYAYASWEKGYGDLHLAPDLASLRRLTWREGTVLVLCDATDPVSHERLEQGPRGILRRQVERCEAAGFRAKAASELEFYLYRDSYRDAAAQGWSDLEPSSAVIQDYHLLQTARDEPLLGAVRRHLSGSGIPVENSKGEWGLGQHELNIRYAEVLEMADRHVVYKQCLKELAEGEGQCVTFMAKPSAEGAGSSCHVHLSLWSGDENAFDGGGELEGIPCSDTFRWFLGGWMAHAPELMALYAPTVNSYKRFQSGSWAPTGLAWSYDNRTAGFRVVGKGSSLRIECRLPGADCNPYLVYAAALASGLAGIEQRIEPPPMFRGDAYQAADGKRLPRNLAEASARLRASRVARAAFGDAMVEHYTHFFQNEVDAYERAVTDWERHRYFEQI